MAIISVAVECFLEVDVVVDEVTLLFQVFENYDFAVEDLYHCDPPSYECSQLFCQRFVGLTFQLVEDDVEIYYA
ncbi:hypothetical protein DPMN_057467 [Dreissena polymorpha]|uniref:Uncharacterized protein n=1 Tax=Dreissena polymorpha TaxID=45954 RepID=A0A9D4HC12_DREPO|nr:hypothetical protein DPMN_057467 [Dreissena polymorpha]